MFNPLLVVTAQAQSTPASTRQNALPKYSDTGVDQSIQDYLCTPSEPADGQDLTRCINKLYRFGIAAGALSLVLFVVIAGYFYITGGEQGKGKAKGILMNAATGMGILLFSYVLLRFINPSLVTFKTIQPPIFSAPSLPTCEEVGFGEKCLTQGGTVSTGIQSGGASGTKATSCPSGLVPIGNNFPTGGSWQICKELGDRLAKVYDNIKKKNYNWTKYLGIGQTFSNPTISRSDCHRPGTAKTGTCVDVGFGSRISGYPPYPPKGVTRTPLSGEFGKQYLELCQEIANVGGIIIHNEAAPSGGACGTFANETHNSYWHLHLILAE